MHLGSAADQEDRPKQWWPSLKFFVVGELIEHIQHIAGDMAKFGDCYWSKCWIYSIRLHNMPSFLGYFGNYLSP